MNDPAPHANITTAEVAYMDCMDIMWPNREGQPTIATFDHYDYSNNTIVFLCDGAEVILSHADTIDVVAS